MGWQYRKSMKVGGARLNIGGKSWGVSTGVKGFRTSTNSKRGTQISVGIPGTGVSYRHRVGPTPKQASQERAAPGQALLAWWLVLLAANPMLGFGALLFVVPALPFIALASTVRLLIRLAVFIVKSIWAMLT